MEKEILAEQQMEYRKQRDLAGLHLGAMLNERDFDRAHLYIDSLHKEYPNDPQFYFCEGWAYDMQGDSVRARVAYTKSMSIYDSLIADKSDIGDMINRVLIVQILYGMEAYNRELDKIQSASGMDSLEVQLWRTAVFNKEELSFSELSEDTI